jgi:membrane protein insertase Oxa1/YidC/SpoIIIJ
MTSLLGVPVDAAYHLVTALTSVLTPVLGGLAAVAGIILLTLAVRLLVLPLSFRAMRGQAVQARIAPQLQELRKRYGKQPERLQREMTALYQREGIAAFAPLAAGVYLITSTGWAVLERRLYGHRVQGHRVQERPVQERPVQD